MVLFDFLINPSSHSIAWTSKWLVGSSRTKAGLAEILIRNDDVILLDEPTNHLDVHAIEWLEGFIKKSNKTILFTTFENG